MTSPLAIIKVDGVAVGLMKQVRVTETMRRADVKGLGALIAVERPVLDWTGSLSSSFYHIRMDKTGIPKAMRRDVPTVQAWIDNVLLNEQGVDIVIMKKISSGIDPQTGLVTPDYEPFATVRGCFIDRESFDISEGQVSGKDQEFSYINPILIEPQ